MDLQLYGKTALITGSTAGIGLAVAERLLAEGADVVINGRTQNRIDAALAKLKAADSRGKASGIAADFSDAASIRRLTELLPEVDILINNVGIFEPKAFQDIPDQDWFLLFEVNVLSGVRLARRYLPGMLARNWGRILFISSESGVQIPTEMIHYGMTKTAQLAVARGIAQTTAGTGVTVNSVLPGPTRSEGAGKFLRDLAREQRKSDAQVEAEFFEKLRPTSLLRRFATTEEVANMVAYLASPLASATNGAAVRVDGGTVPTIL